MKSAIKRWMERTGSIYATAGWFTMSQLGDCQRDAQCRCSSCWRLALSGFMLTFFSQRSSRPSYTRRQPITKCQHKCGVSLFNCSRFCFFVSDLLTSICHYHLIHFFTRERSAESIPVTSICIRNVEDVGVPFSMEYHGPAGVSPPLLINVFSLWLWRTCSILAKQFFFFFRSYHLSLSSIAAM